MLSRLIGAGVQNGLNPFGAQFGKGSPRVQTVGAQVTTALFGATRPPVLDPSRFPHLMAQLAMLNRYKRKLATMAGDSDSDYSLALADGTIAMIDQEGTIFMGASFLAENAKKPGVTVGALAHEIGHRPKKWSDYKVERRLSKNALADLCKAEETKADLFAGRALAEMSLPCDPLIEYLLEVEKGPHPEYYPAELRGRIIKEAHGGAAYRANARRAMFPGFDRATNPRLHLGDA